MNRLLAVLTTLAVVTILQGCASAKRGAPVEQGPPARPDKPATTETPPSWEEVVESEDIKVYAVYVKAHYGQNPKPKGQRCEEIARLVREFLLAKVAEAERSGKRVVHNATTIPADVGGGTEWWLGGGEIELGPVHWYSDPTDVLAVRSSQGFQYIEGRGIGVLGDTLYCFGF